jgi:hypothetical protein
MMRQETGFTADFHGGLNKGELRERERCFAQVLVWNPSKKCLFEVRSFYDELIKEDGPYFPWKNIWRVKAPTRVAFFVWSAALGKILTHNNLRKRNVIVMEWSSYRGLAFSSFVLALVYLEGAECSSV